jgi:glycosyltransferase involved in cell wall biosynthesis
LNIVEAFACGTPAIVRDVGGAGESIDATGGGLIYRTSEELRGALARIAYEPGLRQALAGRARNGFLRLYTSARHVKTYLDLVGSIQHAKGFS